MKRTTKTLTVALSAALVLGAVVVGPADAKKKKKPKPTPTVAACPTFTPVEPQTGSGEGAEALEAAVVTVTDEHTEEAPLVIDYEHGAALWIPFTGVAVQEDTQFFNLQVDSSVPAPGLFLRQEWGTPSPSDMDLYLYDATGAEVALSGSSNAPEPLGGPDSPSAGTPLDQTTGASGYESISGFAAADCAGYTVESRAFSTMGETMQLKIWLGEVEAAE